MGSYFKKENRFSGGNRDFNRRDDDREMHKTTCNKCGKECTVPFRPTGVRPVFCKDCFVRPERNESRGFDNERRDFKRPDFERPRFENRMQNNDQLNAINAKLDRILAIIAKNPEKVQEK